MCSDRLAKISSIKSDIPRSTTPGDSSTCDFDSHADTCCMGRNFAPLYFTDEVVDVTPFTDRYTAMRDVPIASGATHIQLHDGTEYILEVHQGLWFGDQLESSLLNPYQVRAKGIHVWDNPCDPKHKLSMHDPDLGISVPLEMVGTFCSFASRVPTDDELTSLPHIAITDTSRWDPSQASFNLHETEEEDEDQGVLQSSVASAYSKVRRVAAMKYSESDRMLRQISSVFSERFYDEAI